MTLAEIKKDQEATAAKLTTEELINALEVLAFSHGYDSVKKSEEYVAIDQQAVGVVKAELLRRLVK